MISIQRQPALFYLALFCVVWTAVLRINSSVRIFEIIWLGLMFTIFLASISKGSIKPSLGYFFAGVVCLLVFQVLFHPGVGSLLYFMRWVIVSSIIFLLPPVLADRAHYTPKVTHLFYFFCILYFLGAYAYFWEYTLVFSILAVMFFLNKRYIYLVLALGMTILVGQRAGLISAGLVILFSLLVERGNIKSILFAIFLVVVIAIMYFSTSFEGLRVVSTIRALNASELIEAWKVSLDLAEYYTYEEFVYGQRAALIEGGDLSSHLRLRKWGKAYSDLGVNSFFFGLGPGYFGKAADSGLIRIFFEVGFVGFTIFMSLFVHLFIYLGKTGKHIVLCYLITSMFLDTTHSVFCGLVVGFFILYSDRYDSVKSK